MLEFLRKGEARNQRYQGDAPKAIDIVVAGRVVPQEVVSKLSTQHAGTAISDALAKHN